MKTRQRKSVNHTTSEDNKPHLFSVILKAGEASEHQMKETADFFRRIFVNAWTDAAVCYECEQKTGEEHRYTARELLTKYEYNISMATDEDGLINLDEILDGNGAFPGLPCGSGHTLERLLEPEEVIKRIREKLAKTGYISRLFDKAMSPPKLVGDSFAYFKTAANVVEEWTPYGYMSPKKHGIPPNHSNLITRLNQEFGASSSGDYVHEETLLGVCGSMALLPKYRGYKNIFSLQRGLLEAIIDDFEARNPFNIPKGEIMELIAVSEVLPGSAGQTVFETCGGRVIPNFLSGKSALMAARLSDIRDALRKI